MWEEVVEYAFLSDGAGRGARSPETGKPSWNEVKLRNDMLET